MSCRAPDVDGAGRVGAGGAQERGRVRGGGVPAPRQGRVPLLLRHAQRWRPHRRGDGEGAQEDRQGQDRTLRIAGLHPGLF